MNWGFLFVCFCFFPQILSAYFVVLPLRDEGAISLGLSNLPGLFVGSLVLTLIAAPLSTLIFFLPNLSKVKVNLNSLNNSFSLLLLFLDFRILLKCWRWSVFIYKSLGMKWKVWLFCYWFFCSVFFGSKILNWDIKSNHSFVEQRVDSLTFIDNKLHYFTLNKYDWVAVNLYLVYVETRELQPSYGSGRVKSISYCSR